MGTAVYLFAVPVLVPFPHHLQPFLHSLDLLLLLLGRTKADQLGLNCIPERAEIPLNIPKENLLTFSSSAVGVGSSSSLEKKCINAQHELIKQTFV